MFYITRKIQTNWDLRPNPDGQINRKLDGQKTDIRVEPKGKKYKKLEDRKYCFLPNIRSNLNLVNFDLSIKYLPNSSYKSWYTG